MKIFEETHNGSCLIDHIINNGFGDPTKSVLRLAITGNKELYSVDVGLAEVDLSKDYLKEFEIVPIKEKRHDDFTVCFIVPTGIGASIGGHAGDSTPVLHMISEVADFVVTHPNVVNASDINEMPENACYVEGSVLSRLLCGSIGLRDVRANKILTIICKSSKEEFTNLAKITVDSARATYGLNCDRVIIVDDIGMKVEKSLTGRATGKIENIEKLDKALDYAVNNDYDAIAIASMIETEPGTNEIYFNTYEDEVNPWGGAEALLTHYISGKTNLQSAHAPIEYDADMTNDLIKSIENVDPRKAAEFISTTYFQCVLKGLKHAPKIVTKNFINDNKIINVRDIDAIIIPAGCCGIPQICAEVQNIPVIGVRDKICIEKCDWTPKKYIEVENYFEATGVLAALKAGVSLDTLKRPLKNVEVLENV